MGAAIPLPDKHGKDVTDWLDAGHDVGELLDIVGRTPAWRPDGPHPPGLDSVTRGGNPRKTPLALVRLADVQRVDVSWLWPPYIPSGKVTIVEGEEGVGKTWFTHALAATVSSGNGFPPDFMRCAPANVLMLSAEDSLDDTIKPRLVACGADTERVYAVNEALALDEEGLKRLEFYIAEVEPALVIIDPVFAYTPARTDINSANQSRAISAALAHIAEKWGCAFLLVRHIGKARGYGDPRSAGLGSIDWRAAARSVLLVGKNPDDERERAVVQTKNNLAPFGDSIGYTIVGDSSGAEFRWTGVSSLTAAKILAAVTDEDTRLEQSDAVVFLREALRDGPQIAGEVISQAGHHGISFKQLRRARNLLGVTTRKQGGGFDKKNKQNWLWALPTTDTESVPSDTEDARPEGQGHLPLND